MAIVESDPSLVGNQRRFEMDPRPRRRMRLDAIWGQIDRSEVGSHFDLVWQKYFSRQLPVDEQHTVRYHGESKRAHLTGSRLLLSDGLPEHQDRKDWQCTVVRLNVHELKDDGRDGAELEHEYFTAFFSPLATASFYAEEGVVPKAKLHQGAAVKIHLGGQGYDLSVHPFRDLNASRPWNGPDLVVSEETQLPIGSSMLHQIDEFLDRARPAPEATVAA